CPLGIAHPIQNLAGGIACRLESRQRCGNRPIVVQRPRKLLLVVADNHGPILGEQPPQTYGGGHLAVPEGMPDLARCPLAWRRPPIQIGICGAVERRGDFRVAFLVFLQKFGSLHCSHRLSFAFRRSSLVTYFLVVASFGAFSDSCSASSTALNPCCSTVNA